VTNGKRLHTLKEHARLCQAVSERRYALRSHAPSRVWFASILRRTLTCSVVYASQ